MKYYIKRSDSKVLWYVMDGEEIMYVSMTKESAYAECEKLSLRDTVVTKRGADISAEELASKAGRYKVFKNSGIDENK